MDGAPSRDAPPGSLPSPSLLPVGALVAGRFEVESLADFGGMGAVYRAIDKLTGARVGLKVMLADGGGERFAREARVLADLFHPAIVRYVAHGSLDSGAQYLAMEWLDGIDLRAHLVKTKMSVGDSVALARIVADALAAAHARGVVHRDVNPRNLFLVGGDVRKVKLLDFGIARPLKATFAMTVPGVYLGTPGYMAPEQARGADEIDARADVFALGCVLYECLTGRPAFAADNLMALLAKVLFEDAPRLRQVGDFPAALEDLIVRMLSKNVAYRPADATAVAEELADLDGLDDRALSILRDAAPTSITHGEQRLVCVVMAGAAPDDAIPAEAFARDGQTLASAGVEVPGVSPIARFGARIERLADGSIVAALTGEGDATDHASQAARFALALRELVPNARIVLATGRGIVTGNHPFGEALDRASRLLLETNTDASAEASESAGPRSTRTEPIRIDEVTAGLLDLRFDLSEGPKRVELLGARESSDATRAVLGRTTSCVGRDRDLLTLDATYSECVEESAARVVLVTGAAGLGKSRLRREMVRRLRRRAEPMEILVGRADPMSAGAPFAMLAQALRAAAGIADGEPLAVRQQKLAARVARHVSDADRSRVTEFLAELVGAAFPDDHSLQLRAARLDPMLRGDQMRRACEDWLRAECDAQPVLLILEDLHWGDLPTVKLVDSLLRNLRDKPFMVVATARPEVDALFPKVWEQRGVVELRLAELTHKASAKLVHEVLGNELAADVVKRIVDASGGNPFCLEEMIRAEAEGKRDALPGTVLAVAHARLERLEPGSRRVLRAGSVFGQEFWRGAVLALVGAERTAETAGWLDYLVEREVVVRRGRGRYPGDDEYAFQHTLVREAAYAMLTGDDLVLGHRLAAEWLENAGEHDALTLAEHFARGKKTEKAIVLYRRAAEQALEGNDLEAVLTRTEKAIAFGAKGEILGALFHLQAEAHKWCGANAPAAAAAKKAMGALGVGSATWFGAAGELAAASGKLGHREDLLAVAKALLAIPAPSTARADAQVIATARTVTQLVLDGASDTAREDARLLLERIGPHAAAANDPAVAAWVLEARAVWAGAADDPGARIELADAAADSFEQAGDLRNACLQRVSVGYAYVEIGAYDLAERALRGALVVGERMGLDNAVGVARAQLGRALARRGALDEGRAVEEDAVKALEAQGNRRLEGIARSYLAWTIAKLGDLAAAEREASRAVEILAGVNALRCSALATLASILLEQGRAADALASAIEAMRALEAAGKTATGESAVRLVHAEALHATGDVGAARTAIDVARDRITARAQTLGDHDLRRAFLEDFAENAATLERARAWGSA